MEDNPECHRYNSKLQTVYVKKWSTLNDATVIKLSNKLIQVSFKDKIDIIMNGEKKQVIYSNPKKEIEIYSLVSAIESVDSELISHLKRAKELLNEMMTPTSSHK